jgi:secreted trypsin-like serine protease
MCNRVAGSTYEVRLGTTRLDIIESDSVRTISRTAIVHSGYDGTTLVNDIAVIRLPTAVDTNGENYHILMNTKLIFLIHEPSQLLPALLTAQNFIGL